MPSLLASDTKTRLSRDTPTCSFLTLCMEEGEEDEEEEFVFIGYCRGTQSARC